MKNLLRQLVRFALVGGLATALQYVVLVVLVRVFSVGAVPASGTGYVLSAGLNYYLNHRYTFHSTRRHASAVPRFLVVAAGGLLVNQLTISALVDLAAMHYLVAQVLATACVMTWNFVFGRLWTFGSLDRIRHGP